MSINKCCYGYNNISFLPLSQQTPFVPSKQTSACNNLCKLLSGAQFWVFFCGCASLVALTIKNLPAMQETWVWSLSREDPLEKGMAAHSTILAWRIPWIEELAGLQSMELQGVRHNWATNTVIFCVQTISPLCQQVPQRYYQLDEAAPLLLALCGFQLTISLYTHIEHLVCIYVYREHTLSKL